MPEFMYEAKDRFGVQINATIEAADPEEALRLLRERDYEPVSVEEIVERPTASPAPAGTRMYQPLSSRPGGPPRELQPQFRGWYPIKNPWAYFGIAFSSLSLVFMVIFVGGGAPWFAVLIPMALVAGGVGIAMVGVLPARKRVLAWQNGQVAQGRIVSIGQDRSVHINGRHPFMMTYQFDVGGSIETGKRRTFNTDITTLGLDDAVWVTYLADKPKVNAVWPPIK